MHRGRGYIQVSGAAARLVGRQLASGLPEYQEGKPSLGLGRKATIEQGGG